MRRNIKRKFIATLCAVTMIVGNMSISTYADDAALKITKQPTEINPTVTVNKDDATYQWYKAEEDDKYAVEDIAGTIVDDTIIAAPGNSGDMNCEVDGVWTGYNMCVYVGVKAGDVIKVTQLGDYADAPGFLSYPAVFEDDGTGVYTCTATSDFNGDLCIAIENAVVSGKISIVRDGVTYQVVNGMDEVVDGKMMGNPGNATFSDGFWLSNSSGYLSLNVYLKEGQILKVTGDEDCFADMECWAFMGDAEATVSCVDNVYMYSAEEDGIYYIGIDNGISCKAKIEVIDIGRGQAVAGQTTNTLTSVEEGEQYSCLVTCGEEKVWSDYIIAEFAIVKQPTTTNPTVEVNYSNLVDSYQWYVADDEVLEVIDSDDAVADGEIEVYDLWDGEYIDGVWHSEAGMIDAAVSANKGDKVIITLPDDFAGRVYNYDTEEDFVYSNGAYEGVIVEDDGYINFTILGSEDFTAKIQVVSYVMGDAVEGETEATLGNGEVYETYVCKLTLKNGTVLMSDYVTMNVAIVSQPSPENPEVAVNFPNEVVGYQWYEVEVEKYDVVDVSVVNSSDVIGASAQDGVYEDGVWTSEYYDAGVIDAWSVMVSIEVGPDYMIKVVPSTESILDTMWQCATNYGLLKYENGAYYFVTDSADVWTVGLLAEEEFTAEITVEKIIVGDAVEGQTTNEITNHKAGDYICEVTLEDGAVLMSDVVSITDADITHTYTDEYDAECNGCGAIREVPEREDDTDSDDTNSDDKEDATISGDGSGSYDDETSPETGDATNMMLLFTIALAGVIGTFIAGAKKRRYQ